MTAQEIIELEEGTVVKEFVNFALATLPEGFTIPNNTLVEDRVYYENVKAI